MKSKIRGRPPSKNPSIERIELCARKDQKRAYKKKAKECGLALTAWIKTVCDREVE